MAELKLQKRYKYAGDIMPKLLDIGFDLETASDFLNSIPDANVAPRAEVESLNAVHADAIESLRLAAEANKDMSAELKAMRGAANSYKMHYEEAERKYQIAVAEREANVEGFTETLKTIKAEAIKEFAQRLKADIVETGDEHGLGNSYPVLTHNYIDTLVKEMTEESK